MIKNTKIWLTPGLNTEEKLTKTMELLIDIQYDDTESQERVNMQIGIDLAILMNHLKSIESNRISITPLDQVEKKDEHDYKEEDV